MEKQTSRVSESQWQLLLDFLEQNPGLARGYNNTSHGRKQTSRLWAELADKLNAQGSGVSKTPKAWSVYFSNHKSKLKKTVQEITADTTGTGGGPPSSTSILSDYDTRLLAILGPGFGQAAPGVRVNPFPNPGQVEPEIPAGDIMLEEIEHIIDPLECTELAAQIHSPEGGSLPSQCPASTAAPPLPRRRRQTRVRSRPLAPLDEARRILSQVEMQRAAADAAKAQALELIGHHLGRLADAAEAYITHIRPQ